MKILNKITSFFLLLELLFSIVITISIMCVLPKYQRSLRRFWAKSQRKILGYEIKEIGKLDLSANLYILNHQSMLDIMIFEEIHPKDICWIAKKEIAKLFFIGKMLKIPKMIAIDRKNPRSMALILSQAKEKIAQNRPIMIFPEGTRSDGESILKFHKGADILVKKLQLKVQPIVIAGSRHLLDTKKLSTRRGKLVVEYLALADTSDENWLQKARIAMEHSLKKNLKELNFK